MEQRLTKRIAYLQNILDTRFPKSVGITEPTLIVESRTPQIDDDMTDIPEDELRQRDDEEKKLQEALSQIELDKLTKRKPRMKK